ncbi:putative bifunctional diguanylate cyclase/phosphodiesterase [Micromonospora sagamiensis]|nr:GGDEF domain-containing phosphodiesterase [Micromonospora sagamiensis]
MIAVATLSGLGATAATCLLLVSVRHRSGGYRQAHLLLAAGAAVATLSLATGLVAAAVHGSHSGERTGWATAVSIGIAVSGFLGCAGLLRMPGVVGSPSGAVRLLLDGVITAAAFWFVGWVLFSEPTRLLGDATHLTCAPILFATVSAALAAGLNAVVAARAPRPRARLAGLCCGVTNTVFGGLGVAGGLCGGGTRLALAGAVLLAVGLLSAGLAVHTTDPPGQVAADLIRRDSEYAFIPMIAMAASAAYHLLQDGRFDAFAITAGSLEGFALVTRQYLTLHDMRGYAARLAEREAHFRELAHTDPLTGLANRRGLLRALASAVAGREPVALLGLDLDGFKHVNDMRGHDVGDAVLAEVGRRLRAHQGPGDLPARLGGDEFAVLTHRSPQDVDRLARELLHALGEAYEQPDGPVFLSVSVGVAGRGDPDGAADPHRADRPESAAAPQQADRPDGAAVPQQADRSPGGTGPDGTPVPRQADESDVEVLLRHADLALRHAKQQGKNRVERYDATYERMLRRRTTVEHELRGAIGRGELRLAFQPVASLPSVRPVGAEALLRWHHPQLGNVRPDEFIPLAEECGMIAALGAWVLDQACLQLSRWLADGHDVWVSVNVSPRELHAEAYVAQVAEALRAHRVPPQRLVLEVTEHTVATDVDELIRRLTALRRTGVRIALDDFGAGYSSLGQLRRLPIDILKIDHSLVAEHEPVAPVDRDGPPFAPMVDVVMRLGHQLGLEVIAEGVTSPTELAAVVAAGCRFGQGALFGWGVPAEHLEAMLDAATLARPAPVTGGDPAESRPSEPTAAPPPAPRAGTAPPPAPRAVPAPRAGTAPPPAPRAVPASLPEGASDQIVNDVASTQVGPGVAPDIRGGAAHR